MASVKGRARKALGVSRFGAASAFILTLAIAGGCGTTLQYSYEPRASFPALRTYQWASAGPMYRPDPLIESNVRFLVDRALAGKGLALTADKADVLLSISYEFDYGYSYQLRMLTLYISRADTNELVWRGVVTGSIQTDASSGELKKAVEGILANYPPKK
jgi:hypothetical protein